MVALGDQGNVLVELYRIFSESSWPDLCGRVVGVLALEAVRFIYIAAPFFDEIYRRIPKRTARILCILLLMAFAADIVFSLIHPNSGRGSRIIRRKHPCFKRQCVSE